MNFKDALLKIKKEGLLDCIVDESNDYEVCSSIEKEIDSLLSLEPQSSSIEHIVCIRSNFKWMKIGITLLNRM